MGVSERKAGSSVTAKTKAHMEPNATMLPMTRNGGISEKLRLRKPIAVVSDVRKTGQMLNSTAWTAACFRSIP